MKEIEQSNVRVKNKEMRKRLKESEETSRDRT